MDGFKFAIRLCTSGRLVKWTCDREVAVLISPSATMHRQLSVPALRRSPRLVNELPVKDGE